MQHACFSLSCLAAELLRHHRLAQLARLGCRSVRSFRHDRATLATVRLHRQDHQLARLLLPCRLQLLLLLELLQEGFSRLLTNFFTPSSHLELVAHRARELWQLQHLIVLPGPFVVCIVAPIDIITQGLLCAHFVPDRAVLDTGRYQLLVQLVGHDLLELLLVKHPVFVHVQLLEQHERIL